MISPGSELATAKSSQRLWVSAEIGKLLTVKVMGQRIASKFK